MQPSPATSYLDQAFTPSLSDNEGGLQTCTISDLPREVLERIFSNLSAIELQHSISVCKEWVCPVLRVAQKSKLRKFKKIPDFIFQKLKKDSLKINKAIILNNIIDSFKEKFEKVKSLKELKILVDELQWEAILILIQLSSFQLQELKEKISNFDYLFELAHIYRKILELPIHDYGNANVQHQFNELCDKLFKANDYAGILKFSLEEAQWEEYGYSFLTFQKYISENKLDIAKKIIKKLSDKRKADECLISLVQLLIDINPNKALEFCLEIFLTSTLIENAGLILEVYRKISPCLNPGQKEVIYLQNR